MRKTMRPMVWAGAALLAAACSSTPDRPSGPPRAQNDACGILNEREEWSEALLHAQRRWGAPPHVVMAIIWKESSFRHDARPPKKKSMFGFASSEHVSSAFGFSQALDATWADYERETGNRGADRDDWDDAVDFVGWYMTKTERSNGIPKTDAFRQYLNYHEGHAGYRRGTWREKNWLQNAANGVAEQARRYHGQLARCRSRMA